MTQDDIVKVLQKVLHGSAGNKETDMDTTHDLLLATWQEFTGPVRQQWGKLSDDDLLRINGRLGELARLLQQRYGYGRAQAEQEINNWLHDCNQPAQA